MKELKDYTSQELFNELWARDDVVAVKMWTRKDLARHAKLVLRHEKPELEKRAEEVVDIVVDGDHRYLSSYLSDCTLDELRYIESSVVDAANELEEKNNGKEEE